jgi:hypothetical protein
MSQIKNLCSSSSSSLAAHCTALLPILNNSDFLRVISTDLSPHFKYNLRLDLLLLLLLLRYCILESAHFLSLDD